MALKADATLMGAVGLPEFETAPPASGPRRGCWASARRWDVFANLRPVRTCPSLIESSPLKNHLVEGTDMIIVRELNGRPVLRHAARDRAATSGVNTMAYTRAEIERDDAQGVSTGAERAARS